VGDVPHHFIGDLCVDKVFPFLPSRLLPFILSLECFGGVELFFPHSPRRFSSEVCIFRRGWL
jgi:hypothetical protein